MRSDETEHQLSDVHVDKAGDKRSVATDSHFSIYDDVMCGVDYVDSGIF